MRFRYPLFCGVLALALTLPGQALAGVTVLEPADGSTVVGPVIHFKVEVNQPGCQTNGGSTPVQIKVDQNPNANSIDGFGEWGQFTDGSYQVFDWDAAGFYGEGGGYGTWKLRAHIVCQGVMTFSPTVTFTLAPPGTLVCPVGQVGTPPNCKPPGGGGGGGNPTPCPVGYVGTPPHCISTFTLSDHCDAPNGWGLGKDDRAQIRAVAQAYMDAAGDGEDLANNVDLLGIALKHLANLKLDPNVKLAIDKAFGLLEGKLYEEYDLSREVVELKNQRTETLAAKKAAEKQAAGVQTELDKTKKNLKQAQRRGASAEAKALAERVDKQAAELVGLRKRVADAKRQARELLTQAEGKRLKLDKSRAGTVKKLSDLLKPVADNRIAHEIVQFLRVFNLVGDVATIWQYENELFARSLYGLAKKPNLNCDEPWSDLGPQRSTKPNLLFGQSASASPAKGRGVAPRVPALGQVAPGVAGAKAINGVAARLSADVATLTAFQRAANDAPTKGTPSKELRALAGRLGARLQAQPALYRKLGQAIGLGPRVITPAVLAENNPVAPMKRMQAGLKRFHADSAILSSARQGLDLPAVGSTLDLFAFSRGSDYLRAASQAAGLLKGL